MSKFLDPDEVEFWERATTIYDTYIKGRWELFAGRQDKLTIIANGLADFRFQGVALEMAALLSPLELQHLLPQLLAISVSRPRHFSRARLLIQAIPREWLLDSIETAAEPLLASAGEWEYRHMLELFRLLDRALAQRLAQRAVSDPRAQVRQVGEDFQTT